MRKLYYEALSKIPKKFIHDETRCCECGGGIFLANPKFAPMIYINNKWVEYKFTDSSFFESKKEVDVIFCNSGDVTEKPMAMRKQSYKGSKIDWFGKV